jgi:hypothetical protein
MFFVIIALVAFLWARVFAQVPAPPQGCLDPQECRIADLRDYREYLEQQLATAKAALNQTRQQLGQKDAQIKALQDKLPKEPAK